MSKSNTFETQFLQKIFNATAFPWDAAANLEVHLHTADPGETGTTATSECAYGSYAALAVARSGAGFSVSGNTASNVNQVLFPSCTSGAETITHFSVAMQGSTVILFSGALSAALSVSSGIQPLFAPGALTVTED